MYNSGCGDSDDRQEEVEDEKSNTSCGLQKSSYWLPTKGTLSVVIRIVEACERIFCGNTKYTQMKTKHKIMKRAREQNIEGVLMRLRREIN